MGNYNYEEPNWAEDEIVRLGDIYGCGKYIKILSPKGTPQSKRYGKYLASYPDIENRLQGKLFLLIEVKSKRNFYKDNCFLALKTKQYNSYKMVQEHEGENLRIVYLIGNKKDYTIFWSKLDGIDKMETFVDFYQDWGDDKPYPYLFFHSSQLETDIEELFNFLN